MVEAERKQSTPDLGSHSKNVSSWSNPLPSSTLTREKETWVWMKIDLWLIPILAVIYRANIGLTKLPQGAPLELELTISRFNTALSILFVPFCLLGFPTSLALKKFRPSRLLPIMTFLSGIVMISMGFVKTHQQLFGVRACLGFVGAGVLPGVIQYLTFWYPRHKLQYRIGLILGTGVFLESFSPIVAYAISFANGTSGRSTWSWLFIIQGCTTVAVGLIALIMMVDLPSTAWFLTPEEKEYVMRTKKCDDTSAGEEEPFEFRHIVAAVTDWQVWLHILLLWSINGSAYGIDFFLPSIILGFGRSFTVSALLTIPPYAAAFAVLLIFAYASDKVNLRWPFILAGLITSAAGYGINLSDASNGVKYFGTFLCAIGSYSSLSGVLAWISGNLSGQYKRAFALAICVNTGSMADIIAANIYRIQDFPRYKLGHRIELGLVGLGVIILPIIVLTYERINARRDNIAEGAGEVGERRCSDEELRLMGDKSPNFRYWI